VKSALKPAATEPPAPAARAPLLPRLFDGLFGAFLGLCLLKFPNPPLPAFERWVTVPTNGWEFALNSWPIAWGYRLLGLLAVVGLFSARWKFAAPRWLVFLPLAWLFWQVVAGTQTIAPALTKPTLAHLAACVVCFYLGCFCLERDRNSGWFWLGVACAFVLVLAVGIQQRFGGLEETRRYFMLYQYPQMKEVPAEYLKRLSSDRIFATLFYPNALAGLVLLLLPPVLSAVANARRLFTPGARTFIASAIGLSACACLYWSGSKGGWLLMLVLGMVAVLRLPLGKRARTQVLCAMLLLGLAGFFLKYSGFFHKGATSVSARFDYWKAALRTVEERPFFGTGAGTFSIAYERFRPPQAEPSRLVHNDYLEQASDSGLPGFVLYSTFIVAAVFWGYRNGRANWHNFWVWLGVVGWALQGLLEFGLYIPALAWPAFALLGWLVGQNPKPTSPELD
jgi:O-antigen ligase